MLDQAVKYGILEKEMAEKYKNQINLAFLFLLN